MKPTNPTPAAASSSLTPVHTPPSSPRLVPSQPTVTMDQVKKFLVEVLQEMRTLPAPATTNEPEATHTVQPEAPKAQASILEFKEVNEVWDEKKYKYKVVESETPAGELTELDQYIFIVRVQINKKTQEPTFYIDIKSTGLRDILKMVLRDVNGISLREKKLTVERNLLYNYLPELEDYQRADIEETFSPKHLDLFVDYIRKEYDSTSQRLMSLLDHREITYDLLWALFKPNTTIYTTCFGTGKPRCVRSESGEEKTASSGTEYYSLECRYLDFNGELFGEASIQLRIPKFRGTKRLTNLQAFPLQYHPDHTTVKASLVQCGRTFVSLMGSHHRHCHGVAFSLDERGNPTQCSIDSRIMVDAAFFWKMNPNYIRQCVNETSGTNLNSGHYTDLFSNLPSTPSHTIKDKGLELTEMEERDLLICCPTVLGFSFTNKEWLEIAVGDIKDIVWSSTLFDSLVIPDEQKEVVVALAEARTGRMTSAQFDDFVAGKGKGLNVLLHGSPRVGKTLTAEAVAEWLRCPLYSISAGELNTSAAELEAQLSNIFEIARYWKAVLLLDEADIFLERRQPADTIRNGLVSVFLRKLEYCEGIIFFTTNRVSQFDEAVISRMHVMLKYDILSVGARRKIWQSFLDRAVTPSGTAELNPEELDTLVKTPLNGRQIKIFVATAHALATKKKCCVSYVHIIRAVKTSESFMREFDGSGVLRSIYF